MLPQNAAHPICRYRCRHVLVGRNTSNWICGATVPLTSQAAEPSGEVVSVADPMPAGAPGVPDRSYPARAAQPVLGSTTGGSEEGPRAAAGAPATAVRGAARPPPAVTSTARTARTTGRTPAVRPRPGVRPRTRARMRALPVPRRTRARGISATPATARHEHPEARCAATPSQYRSGHPEGAPDLARTATLPASPATACFMSVL